jgi:thiamine kinase-like enzyme
MKKWLSNIVDAMVRIHQVQISGEWSWEYRAYRDMGHIQVPSWTRQPHLWEEAKSRLSRFRPQVHPVFIHRDFHPTNFLWVGEDLSGVVDWVNACRGPAGIDLGHCRVNLAQLYGVETADLLLQFYNSHPDRATEYDPYWDLITFMDFHMDKPTVYGGWEALGIHHLTDDLMLDRCEIYLHSILARF